MAGAALFDPAHPAVRPALLMGCLYGGLAVVDLVVVDGSLRAVLATTAVASALAVVALLRREPSRTMAAVIGAIAVLTLAVHVAASSSRPLVVVLLGLAASSAWAAVVAAGVIAPWQPWQIERLSTEPEVDLDPPPPAASSPVVADAPAATAAETDSPVTDPRGRLMELAGQLVEEALVALVEPDGRGELVVSACTVPGLVGLTFAADSTSATEHTYRTGRRLFLPDPRHDPLVSPTHLQRSDAESMLWQPVRIADVPCAVLVVGWPQRIEQVPRQVAVAIDHLADEAAGFLAQESLLADLRHFASTDVLTGLDSRAAWDAQLVELMDRSRGDDDELVVAIIDLDHFRDFNDTHGPAAGDAHLARFARAARATLRCDGLIARWGGEEFSIALTAITPQAAFRVLDRVRRAVPDGQTCSIGFAVWDGAESGRQLLDRAGRGLQRAKQDGRNRICQAT